MKEPKSFSWTIYVYAGYVVCFVLSLGVTADSRQVSIIDLLADKDTLELILMQSFGTELLMTAGIGAVVAGVVTVGVIIGIIAMYVEERQNTKKQQKEMNYES